MNACCGRDAAQLRKHQTIGSRGVARLQDVGRGCIDGLRDTFCARISGRLLLRSNGWVL